MSDLSRFAEDFTCEAGRKCELSELMYPNYGTYLDNIPVVISLAYGLDETYEFSDNDLKEWDEFGSEAAFLVYLEEQIQRLVEDPCIPLVRKILEAGFFTYWSNAYGSGMKGVWFQDDLEGQRKFFMRLSDQCIFDVTNPKHSYPLEIDVKTCRTLDSLVISP